MHDNIKGKTYPFGSVSPQGVGRLFVVSVLNVEDRDLEYNNYYCEPTERQTGTRVCKISQMKVPFGFEVRTSVLPTTVVRHRKGFFGVEIRLKRL